MVVFEKLVLFLSACICSLASVVPTRTVTTSNTPNPTTSTTPTISKDPCDPSNPTRDPFTCASKCTISATSTCDISTLPNYNTTIAQVKIYPGGDTACIDPRDPYYFYYQRGDPENLLIYFGGGGACWSDDYDSPATCEPSKVRYASYYAQEDNYGMVDKQLENNPFRNWTIVQVVYCSGDVHTGNVRRSYTFKAENGTNVTTVAKQKGIANTNATLEWAFKNIPTPKRLVVAGCSAGSLGTVIWADYILTHYKFATNGTVRAAIVTDGYAGVFPTSQQKLMSRQPGMYRFADAPWASLLPNDTRTRLSEKGMYFCELAGLAISKHDDTTFALIQTTHDDVQRDFFMLVRSDPTLGLNLTDVDTPLPTDPGCAHVSVPNSTIFDNGTLSIGSQTMYQYVVEMYNYFARVGNDSNVAAYLSQSHEHCVTCTQLYGRLNATVSNGTGATNETRVVNLTDWLSLLPLATNPNSTLKTVCDTVKPESDYPDACDSTLTNATAIGGLSVCVNISADTSKSFCVETGCWNLTFSNVCGWNRGYANETGSLKNVTNESSLMATHTSHGVMYAPSSGLFMFFWVCIVAMAQTLI